MSNHSTTDAYVVTGVRVLVSLSAALLVGVRVLHLLGENADRFDVLVGWVAPAALAVAVVAWERSIRWDRVEPRDGVRMAVWYLFGVALLMGALQVLVLTQGVEGVRIVDTENAMVGWAMSGGVVGLLIGWQDLRRKLRTRRALAVEETRRRLERLNEGITVLNRILRHDIRNEATIIQGHVDLLDDELDGHEGRLAVIRESIDDIVEISREARMVEDLMETGGRAGENATEIDVAAHLRERLADLPEGVAVEADLPETCTVACHALLPRALDNIVENAHEHNDEATPRIAVSVDCPDGADRVTVRVADNGPGFPEMEKRVLETREETELQHSSGMGLWLTQWIVRASGGEVSVDDNRPEGAVVTLRLRRAGGS